MATHKDQGLSLLDIGPTSVNIPLDAEGKSLKVFGVSAKGIFSVFQRFPEVGAWFKGGKITVKDLLDEAPTAIAAIIAAGCNEPGNEKAEDIAASLPIEVQMDAIEAILKLTFKSGFGPFVQRMVALSKQAESLNYGRASVMTSPPVSKPVSQQATEQNTSGT